MKRKLSEGLVRTRKITSQNKMSCIELQFTHTDFDAGAVSENRLMSP